MVKVGFDVVAEGVSMSSGVEEVELGDEGRLSH